MPTVEQLNSCFKYMSVQLTDEFENYYKNEEYLDIMRFIKEFKIDLNELYEKSFEFGTVDTYAKYLKITDKIDNYEKLKKTLNLFFIFHQLIYHKNNTYSNYGLSFEKLGRRYLTLFISLMTKDEFPNDIKILSWNYDYQLQLVSEYFRKESFSLTGDGRGTKRLTELVTYRPNLGDQKYINEC